MKKYMKNESNKTIEINKRIASFCSCHKILQSPHTHEFQNSQDHKTIPQNSQKLKKKINNHPISI